MEEYTIFIKGISRNSVDAARSRIDAFFKEHEAEKKTPFSYDFSHPKKSLGILWNEVTRLAGEDLYAVLLCHRNLGTASYPNQLQVALLKLPKTDLESYRVLIEEELCTIP